MTLPYPSLIKAFESLPEPRLARCRQHELRDILFIAICSVLTGRQTFTEMEEFGHDYYDWLKKHLALPGGIPSHDTFGRVFQLLDPAAFTECFRVFTDELRLTFSREIVAVDGKTHRRTASGDQSPLHVINVWAAQNRLVLAQMAVTEKSNEISAVPILLEQLSLKGCVVTSDAMSCQKKTAQTIISKEADYVLALKGNHKTTYNEVMLFMDDLSMSEKAHFESLDKGHGRLEIRRYWHSQAIDWFEDAHAWAGLKSFGLVESIRESAEGQIQRERRYYLSSLTYNPELMAKSIREHWGVENQVHWCLDVFFQEDQSRARARNAAKNFGVLRVLALNLLRRHPLKRSLKGKMRHAQANPNFITELLEI